MSRFHTIMIRFFLASSSLQHLHPWSRSTTLAFQPSAKFRTPSSFFINKSEFGHSYNRHHQKVKRKMTTDSIIMSISNNNNYHSDHRHRQSSSFHLKRRTFYSQFMTTTAMYNKSEGDDDTDSGRESYTLTMDNIYTEWTIDDDTILYKNINEPLHKVASILGRGLNGIAARKKKLKNIDSTAYQRLFVDNSAGGISASSSTDSSSNKLVPVKEVLRRIKWDNGLNSNDFTVQHFDRVEDKIFTCSFDQSNDSVKGKEEMFVFAIPEHRIMSIKYKERVVWDKEGRLDLIFGSMNGNGVTIYEVIEIYEQWKKEEEEKKEFNRRRQKELAYQVQSILGDVLFNSLKEISKELQDRAATSTISDQDVSKYVNTAMAFFRKADSVEANVGEEGYDNSSHTSSIDSIESLNTFSDLVALLPEEELRERILLYIHQLMKKLQNETKSTKKNNNNPQLQPLVEEELTESFVRGSGAGGQKINKTANKVVLVHTPTQIRVECQDTRSLQQNRKIARKRIQLKLDQHFNGVSSRTEMKAAEKISKKAKAKARNKARLRKKKEAATASEKNGGGNDLYDDL